ncbi:MAG: hypothetical protein Q8S94_13285, partial [Pseudohongiella sp.]|nr:hypothetical protein [Pseudohongiella sp.]
MKKDIKTFDEQILSRIYGNRRGWVSTVSDHLTTGHCSFSRSIRQGNNFSTSAAQFALGSSVNKCR